MNDDPFNPKMRRLALADLESALSAPSETPNMISSSPTQSSAPEARACSFCDGAGYYKEAVPYWHPHFGHAFPCVCKIAEWGAQAVERLGDELGDLKDKTFDRFDTKRPYTPIVWRKKTLSEAAQRGLLLKALELCESYADAPRSWLYLFGPIGAGKSHLAAAIALTRASRNEQVRYRSAPGLLDALKAGFDDHTSDAIFDDLLMCDLLVIDDFGAESVTNWAQERFFRLLNERQGKPTVLTSNYDLTDLAPAGDLGAQRIADRIYGQAARILIAASSYRQLPKRGAP